VRLRRELPGVRRDDFRKKVAEFLESDRFQGALRKRHGYADSDPAEELLSFFEGVMRPPRCREDLAQGMMSVYYAGYTLNKWDEEVEKDEKVMEAVERRAHAAARPRRQR
jgi:hypothetical protein